MSRIVKPISGTITVVDTKVYYEDSEHDEEYFRDEYGDLDPAKCGKKIEVEVDPDGYYEIEDEFDSTCRGNLFEEINPYAVAVAVMDGKDGDIFYEVDFCDGLVPFEYLVPVFGVNSSSEPIFAKTSLDSLLMNGSPSYFGQIEIFFDSLDGFDHTMDFDIGWLEYGSALRYRGNDIATFDSFTGCGDYCVILKLTDVHSKDDFNRIVKLHKDNFTNLSNQILEEAERKNDPEFRKMRRNHRSILRGLVDEVTDKEIKSFVGIAKESPKIGSYKVEVLGDPDSSGNYEFHEETIIVKKYFAMDEDYNIFFVLTDDAEYFIEVKE